MLGRCHDNQFCIFGDKCAKYCLELTFHAQSVNFTNNFIKTYHIEEVEIFRRRGRLKSDFLCESTCDATMALYFAIMISHPVKAHQRNTGRAVIGGNELIILVETSAALYSASFQPIKSSGTPLWCR